MTIRTVFRTTNTCDQGFAAEIDVFNDGAEAVTDWRLGFTAPWAIQSFWNAAALIAPAGATRFGNVDMNGTLAPGQKATIGFTAAGQPTPPVFFDTDGPSSEVPPALTVTRLVATSMPRSRAKWSAAACFIRNVPPTGV